MNRFLMVNGSWLMAQGLGGWEGAVALGPRPGSLGPLAMNHEPLIIDLLLHYSITCHRYYVLGVWFQSSKVSKFQSSKLQSSKVSKLRSCKVSKISKFQSFQVSKFQHVKVATFKCPNQQILVCTILEHALSKLRMFLDSQFSKQYVVFRNDLRFCVLIEAIMHQVREQTP